MILKYYFSDKQPNLTPKGTKKRKNKPQVSKKREIIKIKAEVN